MEKQLLHRWATHGSGEGIRDAQLLTCMPYCSTSCARGEDVNCIQGIIVQDGNQKTVICLQTEVLKSMKIELALTDGPNNSLHFQTGATLPHLLSSSTVVLQQHIAEVVESGGVGLQNGGKG